jgi:lipopolysaccharide/colanic/teichoic acid biosynthesis glycosyltransferase
MSSYANYGKTLFDKTLSITLIVILLPIMFSIFLVVLIADGRPILYISERMKSVDESFQLYKFRTMRPDTSNTGVSGGDKKARVTRTGQFLRRTRLDELPQLFNIFYGDMSFVGPRPPLREYAQGYPELYKLVLAVRPGVTGLASLLFHSQEEKILSKCSTNEETDLKYRLFCIPRKAKLDIIYGNNLNFFWDLEILFYTVFGVIFKQLISK